MLSSHLQLRDPSGPMADQSGIEALCDAVFPSSSSAAPGQHQLQPHVKRPRRTADPSPHPSGTSSSPATSTPNHVCHTCKRVYERADHLTRHLRSHENARQYSCSRCPKRFNRPDLLTRHEGTHDREGDGARPIRRTDRAGEACLSCSAAKAKCDDQKPCSRCRAKDLRCEMPSKKNPKYRTLHDVPTFSPSHDAVMSHVDLSQTPYQTDPVPVNFPDYPPESGHANSIHNHFPSEPVPPVPSGDVVFFNPMNSFFQDLDFSWDFSFGDITLPNFDSGGPSPGSTATSGASRPASHGVRDARDVGRRHAAFKRGPWLWEPEYPIDYVQRDTEGLHLNEDEPLSRSASTFSHSPGRLPSQLKMSAATRDRLFAIVLAEIKDHSRVPSFPSLEILDYLLQAHFVHDEYYPSQSWIHLPTFDPQDTLPELLTAVIANGASFISAPSVWQFGLALQEVVRLRLFVLFESSNSNTRKLDCLQTYMLSLGIGAWSGFNRRTELSEAFFQPIVTMLRRAGVFIAASDAPSLAPLESDSSEVLDSKWRAFVQRESFKRLALHVFLHDVHTSIALQKPTLLPFTELCFSLPAARDLWRAPTAEAWRAVYLSKPHQLHDTDGAAIPKVSELLHCLSTVDTLGSLVDLDLCYSALLHAFWNMVTAYRESIKFYHQMGPEPASRGQNSTRRLWIESQQQDVYRDICNITNHMPASPNAELHLLAELLKMTLHISLEELQIFAGKHGEAEAQNMSSRLENTWMHSSDARYAVWHAGQVLRCARLMPPASLRGFNAMAVYFASLALWVYGTLSDAQADNGVDGASLGEVYDNIDLTRRHQHPLRPHLAPPIAVAVVALDGEETRETTAFVQLNRGLPGLRCPEDDPTDAMGLGGIVPLSNSGMILDVAKKVLRGNFPVLSEPLPPLVASLDNLLRDLGSGSARPPSAAESDPEEY